MTARLYANILILREKIMDLLEMETSMTISVRRESESFQSELGKMMFYINDYAEEQVTDQGIGYLFRDMEEIVNEADDILEAFFFHYAPRRRGGYTTTISIFYRLCSLLECTTRRKLIKLTTLKNRLRALNKNLELMEGVDQLRSQGYFDENYLARLKNDVEKLVSIVTEKNQDKTRYNTISIQGFRGIGKTSLAKRVYNDDEVQRYFEGFSWTNVPRNFKTRNVLEDIYLQLVPESKEEINTFSIMELVQQIYEAQLSKKYLIVLDDVWNEDIWTCLNLAFPSYNTASKLVVTTRSRQVAERIADKGITHTMQASTKDYLFSGTNPGTDSGIYLSGS